MNSISTDEGQASGCAGGCDERLLNVDQLAAKLNVPKSLVYRWTRNKDVPFIKVGKKYVRFRLSEILAHFETKK